MNEAKSPHPTVNLAVSAFSVLFLLTACIAGLTSCNRPNASTRGSWVATPEAKDVIGLTEAELHAKYPEVNEIDGNFYNLVLKNLHPYHPPSTNKFLRFGRYYLVAELKDGGVIALHRVRG
jgi:hypothetical protein